jgi:hypothetical protein
MSTRLLWADDDCVGLLQPLARVLEKKGGFALKTATTFADAERQLKEASPAQNSRFRALLVDIILPEALGGRGLPSYIGMTLAEVAVSCGVRSVAFLTVVRQDEVMDKYSDLETAYPDVAFSYFDKTFLLAKGEIDELIDRLRINTNNNGATGHEG